MQSYFIKIGRKINGKQKVEKRGEMIIDGQAKKVSYRANIS